MTKKDKKEIGSSNIINSFKQNITSLEKHEYEVFCKSIYNHVYYLLSIKFSLSF